MHAARFLFASVLCWNPIHAADLPAKPVSQNAQANSTTAGRAASIHAVTTVGPGQAGFVHYFLITHPDNSLEYQVGIELEDQRIAWSFPEAGVTVSEFVKKGVLVQNAKSFKIEHLHGIRPFVRDHEMHNLQKGLSARIAQWVDSETAYCLQRQSGQPFCLSCGDFVVRILYPGPHPLMPALPRDFIQSTGAGYTTDDLLLYLVGLHDLPDKQAMLAKLATLNVPAVMREDIFAMINTGGIVDSAVASVATVPRTVHTRAQALPSTSKPHSLGKIATRRVQGKKL